MDVGADRRAARHEQVVIIKRSRLWSFVDYGLDAAGHDAQPDAGVQV
jgi:hypothetical protein